MMTSNPLKRSGHGPFRPEQLQSGDPYELSDGHPIECLPTGGPGSRANLIGGLALATDPAVESAGVDTGYAADAYTLRAPDLAVGNVPDAPGWVAGAPPLAVPQDGIHPRLPALARGLEIRDHLRAVTLRFMLIPVSTGNQVRAISINPSAMVSRSAYPLAPLPVTT